MMKKKNTKLQKDLVNYLGKSNYCVEVLFHSDNVQC